MVSEDIFWREHEFRWSRNLGGALGMGRVERASNLMLCVF